MATLKVNKRVIVNKTVNARVMKMASKAPPLPAPKTVPVKAAPQPKPAIKTPAKMAPAPKAKKPAVVSAPVWKSVLRLPPVMAVRLKKAAAKNSVSINSLVETIIEVYLKEAKA